MALVFQIPKGASAISFDRTDYNNIGFAADPGAIGGAIFKIRCALHWVGNPGSFRVTEITLSPDVPHPVWTFRKDSEGPADSICFTRADDSDYLIGANVN